MHQEVKNTLACPNCRRNLVFSKDYAGCMGCKRKYDIRNAVPIFLKNPHEDQSNSKESIVSKLANRPALLKFFKKTRETFGAPGATWLVDGPIVKKLVKRSGKTLNVGSGRNLYPRTVNLDIGPYENVHVVGDGKALPFKNRCFDLVLLENVLEHVDEAEKIIKEAYRVLKKEGHVYVSIPFVYVFHGSPDDFNRYTLEGLKRRFELADFEVKKAGIAAGPSSTLNQILRFYLAMLFSFNSNILFSILLNIFGWITFPIKYLDVIVNKHKKAHILANSIYAIGKKV